MLMMQIEGGNFIEKDRRNCNTRIHIIMIATDADNYLLQIKKTPAGQPPLTYTGRGDSVYYTASPYTLLYFSESAMQQTSL